MNPKSSAFQNFVEEQLETIPGLRFRRMFGGFGIYSNEIFFGIIHGEKLYFHTSALGQKRYENAGMTFFTAPGSGRPLKRYYEVPPGIIEQGKEIVAWAKEAIDSVA